MADRTIITPELCRQRLRYDPGSGKLYWKPKQIGAVSCASYARERELRRWNARYAGQEAFTAVNEKGYRHGSINRVRLSAHATAYCLQHGKWPEGMIDHINGNPADNRAVNLRDVTKTENARNARRRADNSSGYNGVSWCKRKGAWLARMCLNGKNKHIGYFGSAEEANNARLKAEVGHFHPNHGRAVCG